MRKYIERLILKNEELRLKLAKARLECFKQMADFEKKYKQLDLETAIKEAKEKDGTPNS